MFTVAICDDNIQFCDQLKTMVETYLKHMGIAHEISVYHSIRNIRYDLSEKVMFDVLFLDIEFSEEEDGVALGSYLRETLENDYTQVVFVSGKEGYAMQLFDIRPLNFLIKPVEEKKIVKILDKVLEIQNVSKRTFSFYIRNKEYRIELGKILYFSSNKRKIRIVCRDGKEYIFNGKISDIETKLQDCKFFSPHKSYLVNYFAVEQWGASEITLYNDVSIPISRNKGEDLKKMQLRYER